jgi:hypothetical protein
VKSRAGLVLLFGVGLLAACTRVAPDAPVRKVPEVRPDSSVINIRAPFRLPVGDVSRLVDSVLPDSLTHIRDRKLRKGILVASLDLDVARPRPVWVRVERQTLITSVPLRAEGSLRIDPGIRRPFETDFVVLMRTTLRANPDWRVSSETAVSYTWITEPYFTILGFKVDLAREAGEELQRQIQLLGPQVDAEIERALDLRSVAEDVWSDLSTPIALGGDPPAWLVLHPSVVRYTPLVGRRDTVEIGLDMEARVETVFGGRPAPVDLGPLPSLGRTSRTGYDLSLRFPVSISYEDASRLVRPHLLGQRFPIGDRVNVWFTSIDLYPSDSVLVAQADFRAEVRGRFFEVEGRVYFEGRPRFDVASRSVVFDSLDYSVESKDALAHAANWMLHDQFVQDITGRLSVPLDSTMASARSSVQRALQGQPLGGHVVLQGEIDEAAAESVELREHHIQLNVRASGTIEARVRNIMRLRTG